ncbi:hypothetical protein YC2023_051941 [Brassica napus]
MVLIRVSTLCSVLEACSSLEVIVLQIAFLTGHGGLKIENKNLKFLQVTFPYYVERFEVNAPSQDVLDIRDIKCESKNNFILTSPNIQFNRNHWVSRCVYRPHISYNVTELVQNNNAPREEGDCSNERLWEDANPFPNADFCVYKVWMYNFNGSSKEEFAFASRFVMQKTVMMKMMIETSSYPPMKKLEVEAAVAKLMELPKGNEDFSTGCF